MKIGYLNKLGKKMSHKKFLKDLKKGEDVEKRLVEYLKKKYPKSYKIQGENKDYDIVIPEKKKTIEVKNDIGSADTPNYFIEFSCNHKKSGIAATKADYWIIYDEVDVIWIKTSILKTICGISGKYWKGIPKGSTTEVEACLIPQESLRAKAEQITRGEVYGL